MHQKLLVVRHCQAEGQAPDAPLTMEGLGQAEELAAFLRRWDIGRIVSSPFVRAIQSVEPLARLCDLRIEPDERLVERILGSSALTWLDRLRLTFEDLDLRFPGGESSREAMDRDWKAVEDIGRIDESTMVVVTHGNLMALLLKQFDDRFGFAEWRSLTNPDVYEITVNSTGTSVSRMWGGNG